MEILFIIWLSFAIVVAIGAKFGRKRSGIGWFVLSVLFSPLLMLILLLMLPNRRIHRVW